VNKRDGMLSAGLLALAAIGCAGMGASLTAEAMPRRRRYRDVPQQGSFYAEGCWVLDWQKMDELPKDRFVRVDGFQIDAYSDGTFTVSTDDSAGRIIHEGRAKNPRLTTAMNAAEKWWAANKENLMELKP
jgi:hypothetical protein